ncbi:hypothetical protein KDN24_09170 [Bacillus sp. Bva_UNVM-123]|uniref:F510_1955 family glycosylhydrolase n=1 Tax=Bacillus sp. Bva_UNVM-123 TaxID=2829798 RepID=UPI00391F2BDF
MKTAKYFFLPVIFIFVLFAAGCTKNEQNTNTEKNDKETAQVSEFAITKAAPQRVEQIYGLGYPGNDSGLYVASQDGIKIFANKMWYEGNSQRHEYVGFQPTEEGFIASGHPEKNTNLEDPLGIIRSSDKGASFEKLAFYGEGDFHFLSVGYETNIIYIINEKERSTLKAGVYRSEDDGKSWEPLKFNGLNTDTVGMIAAHPTKPNLMAMSTRSGIYLSDDKGDNMKLVTEPNMSTALAFSGDNLYYSSVENNKVLFYSMDIHSLKTKQIEIPFLNYDNPITYIAVDQKNNNTLSFSTYLYDVYESTDSGETWGLLLKNGKIE